MCDNQQVFKTLRANIAITMNELNKFPKSPALDAIKAYLKAATLRSMRGVHPLHRRLPPEAIANEVPGEIIASNREVPIFIRATMETTRRIVPKIKVEDAMPTNEANMINNNNEAISTFIRGLRHHDALRTKLLHKRPDSIQDLLTVVKKWADADEADQQIKQDVGQAPRPD
jgi:hypothetical protein